ncbi:MAG TPA: hypothetical protein VGJ20_23760 [Xanthobacteraceae bacterium]
MREVLEHLYENPAAGVAYAEYLADKLRTLRETLEIRAIRRADDRLLAWSKLHRSSGTTTSMAADYGRVSPHTSENRRWWAV